MQQLPSTLPKFIWYFVKPYKIFLSLALISSIYWALDTSVRPYFLKIIVDRLSKSSADTASFELIKPIVFYMLFGVAMLISYRLYDYACIKLVPRVQAEMWQRVFYYLSGHSHRFFQNHFSGSFATKITDLSQAFENIFSFVFEQLVPRPLAIIFALYTMYNVHHAFALLLISWTIIFIGINHILSKPAIKYSANLASSRSILTGTLVDIFSNIYNVRLFARQNNEKDNLNHVLENNVNKDRALRWYMFKVRIFQASMTLLLSLLMFIIFLHLRQKAALSSGDLVLIIILSWQISDAVWIFSGALIMITKDIGKASGALELINIPHEITDQPDAVKLIVEKGEINFKDVSFRYNKLDYLFENLNVEISKGQKVGLVGYSGSGKTTFANLLIRLYDVTSGKITIDGQDISQVTLESLREFVSFIPQDPSLFHRTLMDNLRYGKLSASDDEVIDAAKKAHAHDFIIASPEGYNTLVGERGVKLSGGQRQRIAIARAVLKNAPILILDEATSQLDSVTENLIQQSLIELMRDKTTLVIAHRLSTLLHMDRILVFNKGRIIEDGSHQQLIAQGGFYKKLWDAQVGGFLPDDKIL